jgi:hypothetical protein
MKWDILPLRDILFLISSKKWTGSPEGSIDSPAKSSFVPPYRFKAPVAMSRFADSAISILHHRATGKASVQ